VFSADHSGAATTTSSERALATDGRTDRPTNLDMCVPGAPPWEARRRRPSLAVDDDDDDDDDTAQSIIHLLREKKGPSPY